VAKAYNLPGYQVIKQEEGPVNWFKALLSSAATNKKRKRAGIIIIILWLIWKERNKSVFEQKSASAIQLSRLIQDTISLMKSSGVMHVS
jgi:hypothetical protein